MVTMEKIEPKKPVRGEKKQKKEKESLEDLGRILSVSADEMNESQKGEARGNWSLKETTDTGRGGRTNKRTAMKISQRIFGQKSS